MPRIASGSTVLLVGTNRGLFMFTSPDRRRWRSHGPILSSGEIYNGIVDTRSEKPRVYAADNHFVFGARVLYSDNWGRKWTEAKKPIKFTNGESLKNVWVVQPGRASEPDVIYAGVDPASLWISRDRGKTWQPDQGILENPTRSQWQPGLGGLCMHSIVPHPTDPKKMWVAASAVGVLATDDGGTSWAFRNSGVPARHMPDEFPEYGQCVHRLLIDPSNPDRLVQQNHWGMFESLDGGRKWTDIQSNMPSAFGFPMGMDRSNTKTLYAIPETPGDQGRHNIGDQFSVWRSFDSGTSWEQTTKGLPKGKHVRLGVLRHAMATDDNTPAGVYVGTNTGQLFATTDRGESWKAIANFMPKIYSVNVATIP
ncbi:MAG: WD40/YVTN/BNR-like repeat-containing protein [Actinomycetota bacterium]